MIIETWTEITLAALQELWMGFILFIPRLIGTTVIFLIGWFLANIIGRVISEILRRIKFNSIFERAGWQDTLEKAEIKTKPSEFIGAIGKWIVAIVFLVSAIKILFADHHFRLEFLDKIVNWLPNLIVAVVIFVIASIVADILGKIIQASVRRTGLGYARMLGMGTRWAIYILAGLMILRQLGVTPTIIDIIVMGLVGSFMLAFGLAFGLGGKEVASKILEDLRKEITE